MNAAVLTDRLRMALAEAGYPDAAITQEWDGPHVELTPGHEGAVPSEVCWRAFRVAGCPDTPACYPCWRDGSCDEHDFVAAGGTQSEDTQ